MKFVIFLHPVDEICNIDKIRNFSSTIIEIIFSPCIWLTKFEILPHLIDEICDFSRYQLMKFEILLFLVDEIWFFLLSIDEIWDFFQWPIGKSDN